MTMAEICDDFKAKNKPPKGAWLPAEPGAVAENPSMLPSQQEHNSQAFADVK